MEPGVLRPPRAAVCRERGRAKPPHAQLEAAFRLRVGAAARHVARGRRGVHDTWPVSHASWTSKVHSSVDSLLNILYIYILISNIL